MGDVVRGVLLALLACSSSGCALLFPPQTSPPPDAQSGFVVRAKEGPLLAGAATVDISPQTDLLLGGFGIWRRGRGVHDPIHVRALALQKQQLSVVILSADLIGLHHHVAEEVRARLWDIGGFDGLVLLHCTHNHDAPDTLGMWGLPPFVSGIDGDYLRFAIDSLERAARQAVAALAPVRVRWGQEETPGKGISRNLREPMLVDRRVTALAFDRFDGLPVATLVHFACHPETLGSRNRLVSADFPGAMARAVEESRPGSVTVFLNGPLGGMVTVDEQAETFEEVERIGRGIAATAIAAIAQGQEFPNEAPLITSFVNVDVPIQNRAYHLANLFGLFGPRRFHKHGERRGTTPSDVQAILLGPLTIVTAYGELLPRPAFEFEGSVEVPGPLLIVSLGNDELGYLIHERDFARRKYRYERTVSPGPLATTLWRQAAAIVLDAIIRQADGVSAPQG